MFEEHQRTEWLRVCSVTAQEMQPDRKSDCCDTGQKPWCKKAQLNPPMPDMKVLTECFIKRPVAREQKIIDSRSFRLCFQLLNMIPHFLAIHGAGVVGRCFERVVRFHVDQHDAASEFWLNFLRIENVQQNQ